MRLQRTAEPIQEPVAQKCVHGHRDVLARLELVVYEALLETGHTSANQAKQIHPIGAFLLDGVWSATLSTARLPVDDLHVRMCYHGPDRPSWRWHKVTWCEVPTRSQCGC